MHVVLKLPRELTDALGNLDHLYQRLANIVWWDGFYRGAFTGVLAMSVLLVVVTLFTSKSTEKPQ